MGTIEIGKFRLSITPIKYNSSIYWVTCPHGIFIESDKEYTVSFNSRRIKVCIYKQAYWADIAIFSSEEKVNIKNIRVLKSHSTLLDKMIYNKLYKLKGRLSSFNYERYLGLRDGNRNLYYKVILDSNTIKNGMSGSGFYYKNTKSKVKTEYLIGILSFTKEKPREGYLVPGFLILRLLEQDRPSFSPFLPLKLRMDRDNVVLDEDCGDIKKDSILTKFNGERISRACIYVSELRDNLPIDVFLQIFGVVGESMKVSDTKRDYELEIRDLNEYIEIPFISAVPVDKKGERETYQDMYMRRN